MNEIRTLDILETALRLKKNVEKLRKRHIVSNLKIDTEPRIKVLRGFRGVGKTTALLQLMDEKSAYFSMDNPIVSMHSLYDIGKQFIMEGNVRLFIDEVHYYKKWKEDTKALYDEFPKVSIVLSGSAPLALEPERRYEIVDIEPLSLHEFIWLGGKSIQPTESWTNINETLKFLAENQWIYSEYNDYIRGGAFPTYFEYREKTLESIYNSIQKSITEDAIFLPNVDGEMIVQMKKALIFLATSSLGEFSINSLSKILEITKNRAYHMISLLEAMKILRLVRPYGGGAKLIRGEPKLMFCHPVMRNALCNKLGVTPNKGALCEELAVFSFLMRGWKVNTVKGMKRNPDYIIEKGQERIVVEIDGISKGTHQLKGFKEKTILMDEKQLITLSNF